VQKQLKVRSRAFSTLWLNKIYHKADAVIVQTRAAKEALEGLGVDSARVYVIPHGTHIPKLKASDISCYRRQAGLYHQRRGCTEDAAPPAPMRETLTQQIVFCGGHHLTSGKGFDVFLKALLILKEQNVTPKVMVYGLNAIYGQGQGQKLIFELGVDNRIRWFDYKSEDSLFEELQRALCMVIPYTTSEAGNAVTAAMANAVPVIATTRVGLPEYLEKSGLYIQEDNPQDLADKILQLIHHPDLRETLGMQLYRRALELYSWESIAQKTLYLYMSLLGSRSQRIRVNPAVTKC
jgi:glycosyltransferase involved in cell wall biosynthesis